jgi:hypothetical protein
MDVKLWAFKVKERAYDEALENRYRGKCVETRARK